jgi:hypothetical protein
MQPLNVLERIWETLRQATTQRTGFTLATLATVTTTGQPRARSVILREFATAPERIAFATDARSAKVAEIQANPGVALACYDPTTDTQLRMEGTATVVTDELERQRIWQNLAEHSKAIYANPAAPGTPLASVEPSDEQPAFDRFAWVSVAIEFLDWLELAAQPHRRWHFQLHDDHWTGDRVVP